MGFAWFKKAKAVSQNEEWTQRCLVCGYDVRELPIARCPECGAPFERDVCPTCKGKARINLAPPIWIGILVLLAALTYDYFWYQAFWKGGRFMSRRGKEIFMVLFLPVAGLALIVARLTGRGEIWCRECDGTGVDIKGLKARYGGGHAGNAK